MINTRIRPSPAYAKRCRDRSSLRRMLERKPGQGRMTHVPVGSRGEDWPDSAGGVCSEGAVRERYFIRVQNIYSRYVKRDAVHRLRKRFAIGTCLDRFKSSFSIRYIPLNMTEYLRIASTDSSPSETVRSSWSPEFHRHRFRFDQEKSAALRVSKYSMIFLKNIENN